MDMILDILAAVGILVIVLCLGLLGFKVYLMSLKNVPPAADQKHADSDDEPGRHRKN